MDKLQRIETDFFSTKLKDAYICSGDSTKGENRGIKCQKQGKGGTAEVVEVHNGGRKWLTSKDRSDDKGDTG